MAAMASAHVISRRSAQCLLLLLAVAPWAARAETMQEITNRLLVGYNRDTNPTLAAAFASLGGPLGPDECPTEEPASNLVETQIYVTNLANIDQKAGTYELEGFLRHWWCAADRLRRAAPRGGRSRASPCGGTWARVTIDQLRHLALQTLVERGHVSLLTILDTWHPKTVRSIGHLLICSQHSFRDLYKYSQHRVSTNTF